MRITLRSLLGTIVLTSLVLTAAGCGSRRKIYQGKLVQNGQPVVVSDKGVIIITFYEEKDKDKARPLPTDTKPDGSFTVYGRERKGIAPGRYVVAVEVKDPYIDGADKFEGKFAPDKTPLTVEAGRGKGDLIIEVGP
jgi:hypothetical protein